MGYILKLFGVDNKETSDHKSQVYTFFAEAGAEEKTKAYKKALRGASEDQMRVITRYNKEFVHTN